MPAPSPAYLWYPKDALSSGRIDELTAAEECWYRRALDRSWLDDGVPSDPERLARQIKKDCTIEAAQMILDTFFEPKKKDPAKMINPRQEIERTNLQKSRKKKSEGGRKGMENRWKREKQKTSGDNIVITELYHSNNIPIAIATPISKEEKNKNTTTTASKISDDEWLDSLQSNPAYKPLNVRTEFSKATIWAETNNRQCTRRFFVNWLNRVKPIITTGVKTNGNSTHANTKALNEWAEFAKQN